MGLVTKLLANSQETALLGQDLARQYGQKPGLIFLRGELGAGKTTIAQSFIKYLVGDNIKVSSPTYSYMNSYVAKIPIYHFDLYRIEDPSEIYSLGLEEFLNQEQTLRIVEWPQMAQDKLPLPDLSISLQIAPGGRIATINSHAVDTLKLGC